MIKKTRTYLQKYPNTDEAMNTMIETLIDGSLNLFVVNVYTKPVIKDMTGRVTRLGWTLCSSHAFTTANLALRSAETLIADNKHEGFTEAGNLQRYLATKNLGYCPTHTQTFYTIESFAEHLIEVEKHIDTYGASASHKKYLLERALKAGMDEVALTKRARTYVKSVGLEVEMWGDGLHVRKTKR